MTEPAVVIREENELNRQNVKKVWTSISDEERATICSLCSSYFPNPEGGFICLSGHQQTGFAKPCPSFARSIFRFCDDWKYTVEQAYKIRELEAQCRRHNGENDEEDEE